MFQFRKLFSQNLVNVTKFTKRFFIHLTIRNNAVFCNRNKLVLAKMYPKLADAGDDVHIYDVIDFTIQNMGR